MLVLIWNLFHGRAEPAAGRPLLVEFARMIAGWEWDVALLQEVPPWWPAPLAHAAGAEQRTALTSRNSLLAFRRAIASRNPDLIAANGGGANAILVRGAAIGDHREVELTRRPERRVAHGVRLGGGWVVNIHATTAPDSATSADIATARASFPADVLVFGGDFNIREPRIAGLRHVGGRNVDHVFAPGPGSIEVLDAGTLSDHRPLRALLG